VPCFAPCVGRAVSSLSGIELLELTMKIMDRAASSVACALNQLAVLEIPSTRSFNAGAALCSDDYGPPQDLPSHVTIFIGGTVKQTVVTTRYMQIDTLRFYVANSVKTHSPNFCQLAL
jgi:hypothetical protein